MLRKSVVLASVAAGLMMAAVSGCESTPSEVQPSSSELHGDNRGVQSKNVQEMSEKMASSILQCQAVTQDFSQYKTKLTVTMKPIVSDQGQDLTITVARMRVLLNKFARDRLAFTEDVNKLRRIQDEEFGRPPADPTEDASRHDPVPQAPDRLLPGYALHGDVRTLRNNATTYYLFTFRLTRIMPGATGGEIVWEDMYELSSLN